jgi:hypothetical protein
MTAFNVVRFKVKPGASSSSSTGIERDQRSKAFSAAI